MNAYEKDGHTVIEAGEGNFLMRKDGSDYSVEFSLGCYDSADNYEERPMDEWHEDNVI